MLADILDEENAAVDSRQMRVPGEVRDHREIAAPERSLAGESGPSSAQRTSYRPLPSTAQQCSSVNADGVSAPKS